MITKIYTGEEMKNLNDIQQRKKYMINTYDYVYQNWIAKCV